MLTIVIDTNDHCRSLESLLRNRYYRAPSAYLRQLARSGKVAVNGAVADIGMQLRLGDTVTLRESARLLQLQTKGVPPLDILHEDDRLLALNKPSGLAVHRTAEDGEDTLLDRARQFFAEAGVPVTPRPVNRLDRGTSGAVILAKGGTAAGIFGRMVKEVGLAKLYLAIAEGELPAGGRLDLPVDGKESSTLYQRLLGGTGWSVLAVWPLTGRMHQIRRHLAATGAPVMGDRRYGSRTLMPGGAFALHSFRTAFVHPESGQKVQLTAPIPPSFTGLLERLAPGQLDSFLTLVADLAPLEPQVPGSEGDTP
jgi:23S rRNA pseudouridine955/2504/2580 synthase